MDLLPKEAVYYFSQAKIQRALPVEELFGIANQKGLKGEMFSTIQEALDCAKKRANKEDIIFIGGSTFVVAEVV